MQRSDKIGAVVTIVLSILMIVFLLWPRKPAEDKTIAPSPNSSTPPPPADPKVDAQGLAVAGSSNAVGGALQQAAGQTGAPPAPVIQSGAIRRIHKIQPVIE